MTELSPNVQKVFDLIKELNAVDLNALVKGLEEEFGVTAAASVVSVAWWATGDEWWAAANTDVNIELTDVGPQKIGVIKVVKELFSLWLKEAKDLVEKAPTIIKENVKSEEADVIKEKLEAEWAKVSFK